MPVVWIPSLMQSLTDGQEQVRVEGETLREVVANLERAYPGVKDRVCEEDRIRPGLAVSVDGVVTNEGMRHYELSFCRLPGDMDDSIVLPGLPDARSKTGQCKVRGTRGEAECFIGSIS